MPTFDLSNCPCCHPPCSICDPETLPTNATATIVINSVPLSDVPLIFYANTALYPEPNWHYEAVVDNYCDGPPDTGITVFFGCFDGQFGFQVQFYSFFLVPLIIWNFDYLTPIVGKTFTCDPFYFHWTGLDDVFAGAAGGETACLTMGDAGTNTLEITINGDV